MFDLNKIWISIECPKCNYQDEVQLFDVKSEKTIFCHNCKIDIKLIDENTSVHTSVKNVNNKFKEIENLFKSIAK